MVGQFRLTAALFQSKILHLTGIGINHNKQNPQTSRQDGESAPSFVLIAGAAAAFPFSGRRRLREQRSSGGSEKDNLKSLVDTDKERRNKPRWKTLTHTEITTEARTPTTQQVSIRHQTSKVRGFELHGKTETNVQVVAVLESSSIYGNSSWKREPDSM